MNAVNIENETKDLFEILHDGEWITLREGMVMNNWTWKDGTWERIQGRFRSRPVRNVDYRKKSETLTR